MIALHDGIGTIRESHPVAAFATAYSSCQLSASIQPLSHTTCAACSVANEQRTSRNHPAEATHMRSSGRAPTIRKQIENRLLVRMQQAHISARPIPALGCLQTPRSRRALLPPTRPLGHRTNLKARSNLQTRRCEHFT